jgi:hypothetical protein
MISVFEIVMLACFGISWPFAIIKTIRSKTVKGVTPVFYWLVFMGYIAGTLHKIIYSLDPVIILYVINSITVGTQIILFYYYRRLDNKEAGHEVY